VTFADAKHGWMRIGFADPQGSDDLLLLATEDGGRSWELLSDPPSQVGCVHFSNAKDGWVTDESSATLRVWRTRDGGQTWLEVSPRVPKRLGEVFGDYGIAIRSRKQVSVAAYVMSSSGDRVILFLTEDQGRTWKREITLPTLGWTHDALEVVGSSIIRGELSELSREAPKQTLTLTTFTAKGVSKRQQAEAPSLPPLPEGDLPACPTTLSGLNMIDENRGWAYVSCGITDLLFATADAGKSWSNVSPAAVPKMTDYRLGGGDTYACPK
jgi:photosystem II stability/assembly factor-like uncharacterized protein